MEWKHPSIIAMKGFPFTGKTSLAYELALHLRLCLLLDLDDILDSITPPHYSSTSPPPPPEADQLTTRAFDILYGLVEKQLSIGLSVIIDSLPLSRPHLDRLLALSKSFNTEKFIIVECKIEREYAWRKRFENEFSSRQENLRWYKPMSWLVDVTKLVDRYDKSLDEPISGVSRLFVNVDEPVRGRHIIQAIQTLIFCPDDRHHNFRDHGGHTHDPNTCTDSCHGEKELIRHRLAEKGARLCKGGHSLTVFKGEGLGEFEYEANCGICENPIIIGAAYECDSCDLALHKSCAEMRSVDKRLVSFSPQDFPTFIRKSDPGRDPDPNPNRGQDVYSFPENHACLLCREAGEGFSDNCSSCIFESHLKCGLIPAILDHEGHKHKLHFWAMRISDGGSYVCAACGKKGASAAYGCTGCNTNLHAECALLPYPIEDHLHGGHKHTLELMFSRDEDEFDEYPCDYCLEVMNPEDWYYHCGICPQTYHLKCAFMKDDEA